MGILIDVQGLKETEQPQLKRQRLGTAGELGSSPNDEAEISMGYETLKPSENNEPKADGGGLLVATLDGARVGIPRTARAVSTQWFSQDLFKHKDLMDDIEGEENEEEDEYKEGGNCLSMKRVGVQMEGDSHAGEPEGEDFLAGQKSTGDSGAILTADNNAAGPPTDDVGGLG